MHHKEVCLTVDTAKLIFLAFPSTSRMVVAGIGPEYQTSMEEFLHATREDHCLVLFPDDDAKTYKSIVAEEPYSTDERRKSLIVIDGTWEQARKLYKRYIAPHEGPRPVQLTEEALQTLTTEEEGGRQLRRHPQLFREISTLAALRLFLRDVDPNHEACTKLTHYQKLADAAARKQLGEIRYRQC
jgi:DTW domain-containing protein YfiP